jgi:hypothetical protein
MNLMKNSCIPTFNILRGVKKVLELYQVYLPLILQDSRDIYGQEGKLQEATWVSDRIEEIIRISIEAMNNDLEGVMEIYQLCIPVSNALSSFDYDFL